MHKMGTVVKKTANAHGTYRVLRNVDISNYPSADWLHDPDLSGVINVPEKFWKNDSGSIVEMTQGEKDTVIGKLTDVENPILAGTLGFEKNNLCRNKWLGFGSSKSSNVIPYISPCPMRITAITFVNAINGADTDVEIHKNGTKLYTWEVLNKRWAWKTEGLHTLTFETGDRIGIYLKDRGTDPRNVIVTLHYASWYHNVGEGGSSTL